jgi:cytochrome c5
MTGNGRKGGLMPRLVPLLLCGALIAGAGSVRADTQPVPFKAGDPKAGKVMVERDCVGCHAQRFAGDPDQMYRRADRRVKSPAQLLAQVQGCNANLGKGYFPEEEEHIAAYLNLEFYRFKP